MGDPGLLSTKVCNLLYTTFYKPFRAHIVFELAYLDCAERSVFSSCILLFSIPVALVMAAKVVRKWICIPVVCVGVVCLRENAI